jgi:hypothetical protein
MSIFLLAGHHVVDQGLLADLEDVGRQPVEDEPALEVDEKYGHYDWHGEHHLGLGGVGGGRRHFLGNELRVAH